MAFEYNPGQGSLFRNDRKTTDKHPDYNGQGKLEDGTEVWISAWIKEGNKGKFMSLSIQAKEDRPAKPEPVAAAPADDDMPF